MKQTKSHIHRHTRRRILSALTACGLFLSLSITGCSNAPEEKRLLDQEYNCFRRNFFRHSIFFASRRFYSRNTKRRDCGSDTLRTGRHYNDQCVDHVLYLLSRWNACASVSFRRIQRRGISGRRIVSDVAKSDDETVQNIIDATGTEYMHIIPSSDLRTGFLKNVQSVPTTFFVDSNGKQIGDPYLGAKDQDAWAKIIEEMLRTVQENNKAGE